tara:strand:- start:273 stop:605 length:333 start_codon:yes stop_codon:yes gene_type:complete
VDVKLSVKFKYKPKVVFDMAKYKTKSLILGRKKRQGEHYPCFVNLFSQNDPHISNEVPDQFLDFEKISKVDIKDLNVIYLPAGNDIVINSLKEVSIVHKNGTLKITGKQS